MRAINFLCALFLGLLTSVSTYAGVTADGTTAYRLDGDHATVVFTNIPSDDPFLFDAHLGAAYFTVSDNSCRANTFGPPGIAGLYCSGTSGNLIKTYTCEESGKGASNATATLWCLFSENPRIGGKAWAVKYVNGEIPTNDGASIVRCQETDIFEPIYGCWAPPSQISIEGGFIKLDTTDGSVPFDGDCAMESHNGRMVVDDVNNDLYICTASGWMVTPLSTP